MQNKEIQYSAQRMRMTDDSYLTIVGWVVDTEEHLKLLSKTVIKLKRIVFRLINIYNN